LSYARCANCNGKAQKALSSSFPSAGRLLRRLALQGYCSVRRKKPTGILFVMLVGREVAISFMGKAFWIALAVGTLVLIVLAIVAFIRFTRLEVRLYREEVSRDRREGRPWLYTLIAWPGIIGNFAVFGLAGFHYLDNECQSLTKTCLEQIPFWWFPVSFMLLSMPVMWIEKLILKWRKTGPPAVPGG
jgi:hypothetical protein